jgi:hypothetical protein
MKQVVNTLGICMSMLLLLFYGCAKTVLVEVPPRFVPDRYTTLGIVEFSSNSESQVGEKTTQKFIQAIQQARPGTVILELGSRARILSMIKRSQIDSVAIKNIGDAFGVDAVIIGSLDISPMQPRVNVKYDFTQIKAQTEVEVSINAKILETGHGATVWTTSRSGRWVLSRISGNPDGIKHVGISTLAAKYDNIISEMVFAATKDFRPTYVKRIKE